MNGSLKGAPSRDSREDDGVRNRVDGCDVDAVSSGVAVESGS